LNVLKFEVKSGIRIWRREKRRRDFFKIPNYKHQIANNIQITNPKYQTKVLRNAGIVE